MGEGNPSARQGQTERRPQGGHKDTDDLSSIKDVQQTGMQEKAQQVENLPEEEINPGVTAEPRKR
ncbi:hypothetical protein D3875_19480 [Deinococcus cavernae]|uniref:Uncharacterized protein n=1 Tax=Deinococcus cavernae TaxID=2320857 RepID=A0A418VD34_9DEIO|nr:hypothetical protein [Deinococcus cavernae]RJF73900.1 hypothetical protein D3875_19480 [Deinococcus cavernae]